MGRMRSTLVLCVAAIGLGGYAYFIEADRPREPMADQLVPVFDFESDDITTLTVTAENGNRTVVDNTNARWRLLEPFEGNVDVTAVVGLASSIATLEMQRVVAEPEDDVDLVTFGLNEPRITVGVTTSSGTDTRLLIGARTPTGGDVYASVAGSNRVFLMSGYLDDTFNQSTFDLRDKTILNFTNDEVEGLEVAGDEVAIQLRKTGTRWELTNPIAALADVGAADGVIGRLSTGQIASVESETPGDLAQYGLAPPRLTVTVRLTGSTSSLIVGSAAGPGRIYARDESREQVFTVDETLVGELVRNAEAYRRKEMFGFRPFNAESVSLERDGVLWSVEKSESDDTSIWRMVSPNPEGSNGEIDGAAMEDVLAKLSNLRAESFVDSRDETGLTTPVASLRVTFRDSDENIIEERVIVGRPDGDAADATGVFAVNGDEPGAARLNPQAWDDTLEALDALADAPGTAP